jgi:hypothetical protein
MTEVSQPLPTQCFECAAALCVRQTTINLSLGNLEQMKCLVCLAAEEDTTPEQILSGAVDYILGRECFRKEWVRYQGVQDCPDPLGCIPAVCFGKRSSG